eukprot:GCRY01000676.1.p1 GENE.GCRY01000676.1~~GCRY01000676.1.p1  ORF type:complete len:387 (-),score=43.65 GCRY01000676.1:1095-2255(-)
MRRFLYPLFIFFLFQLAFWPVLGDYVLYLSPNGNDSENDCQNQEEPCLTFFHIVSLIDLDETTTIMAEVGEYSLNSTIALPNCTKLYFSTYSSNTVSKEKSVWLSPDETFALSDDVWGIAFTGDFSDSSYLEINNFGFKNFGVAVAYNVISHFSRIFFQDCVFASNNLTIFGDAVAESNSRFLNCEFYNNSGGSDNGPFTVATGTYLIESCSFHDNKVPLGTGLVELMGLGRISIQNSRFENNTVLSASSAGVFNAGMCLGEFVINQSQFRNNSGDSAGAISVNRFLGTGLVNGSTFTMNTARTGGGAVYCGSKSINYGTSFTDNIIFNNSADTNAMQNVLCDGCSNCGVVDCSFLLFLSFFLSFFHLFGNRYFPSARSFSILPSL